MGQSVKKRIFKIWRKNRANKSKFRKRLEKNIEILEKFKIDE